MDLQEVVPGAWIGFIGLCESNNEPSVSIKSGGILD
jgi:hypothetical protein